MPYGYARVSALDRVTALLLDEHYLRDYGNAMTVNHGHGRTELGLHGCSPHELDLAVARWPLAENERDEYGHLRWVEVQLDRIEVTLFHR